MDISKPIASFDDVPKLRIRVATYDRRICRRLRYYIPPYGKVLLKNRMLSIIEYEARSTKRMDIIVGAMNSPYASCDIDTRDECSNSSRNQILSRERRIAACEKRSVTQIADAGFRAKKRKRT